TDAVGLPIAVRTADCCPILLYDPIKKVVAAVHAGWKSAHLNILLKTVEFMKNQWGSEPSAVRAALGPCIRQGHYRVGEEFKEYFPHDVKESVSGLCFDLAGTNIRQLLQAGVLRSNILDSGFCTFKDAERFFSYRREKESAGRMANLIMMT
ncbi:MAG: polyphenol oxidase family protein, partial [Candidatus Omnitrophica bacterium]|nr:polyphenol oxidase family protein [Candidatus Omnitrophota bacterium]